MPRIEKDARSEWLLLQSIYPVFERKLPSINDTGNVVSMPGVEGGKAKLQLHLVQANRYITKNDFHRFLNALSTVLKVFEAFVDEDFVQQIEEIEQPGVGSPSLLTAILAIAH